MEQTCGTEHKISVIVPVYNEDEYIDSCIDSIVRQTYTNLEILLVDDGSSDSCPEICDQWGAKDKRIKIIHKKNGGLVSARKAGIKAATGQYIGYVDGDDRIEPDMYQTMMETMQDTKADVVITGFKKELFGKEITCLNDIPPGVYNRQQLIKEVFPKMIFDPLTFRGGLYTYVWNKLFKKEKIAKYQMNVDDRIVIGEDSACVYPLLLNCDAIAVTCKAGYHYRQRMDSLLRKASDDRQAIDKLHLFYQYMARIAADSPFKNILMHQIDSFYTVHLLMMSDVLVSAYPDLEENFPFLNAPPNSRIILYSAGAYGIHVYRQFSRAKRYEVAAWTDPDFEQYAESAYNVVSLGTALQETFDYIIVASMDLRYIDRTEMLLKNHGIGPERIITIRQNMHAAVNRLKERSILA